MLLRNAKSVLLRCTFPGATILERTKGQNDTIAESMYRVDYDLNG